MRYLSIAVVAALGLSACASQPEAPKAEAKPAAAAPVAKKAPQCYSGDHGKFFDVGATATISGVAVTCEATSDGSAAQWMGKKK